MRRPVGKAAALAVILTVAPMSRQSAWAAGCNVALRGLALKCVAAVCSPARALAVTSNLIGFMNLSHYFDRIAISLSAICIVHCLAVPLLIVLLPVAALSFGGDSHFHAVMLWLVVPISVLGLVLGYRVHARARIVVVGLLGMAIVAFAAIWGHAQWPISAEISVSLLGSLLLAGAHWFNFDVVRRVHVHHG